MTSEPTSTAASTDAAVATTDSDPLEIVLYWLNQSRSQRILWLLEELKLPYKLEIFHRDGKTKLAPPELKKIHALGKSPVISVKTTEKTEPITIAESAFIIEYLLEHFGKNSTALPKQWKAGQEGKVGGETEEWMRYKYFLHYGEGSLMSLLLVSLVAENIKSSPVPFFIKPITSHIAGRIYSAYLNPNYETHFGFLEEQLRTAPGGGGYLCGPSLTGADMLLSFPLIAAKDRAPHLTDGKCPLLLKYINKLEQEPGYKKAVEKIVEIEGSFSAV